MAMTALKIGERWSYTAEVWSYGHMIKVDLLDDYQNIIGTVIAEFGEDFEIGELEGFDGVDTDEDYSLLELNQMAHFLSVNRNRDYAKLLLNTFPVSKCWDFDRFCYIGLYPNKEEIAEVILRRRFDATSRLIKYVDLVSYLDSLIEDEGVVLIPEEDNLHAFVYGLV